MQNIWGFLLCFASPHILKHSKLKSQSHVIIHLLQLCIHIVIPLKTCKRPVRCAIITSLSYGFDMTKPARYCHILKLENILMVIGKCRSNFHILVWIYRWLKLWQIFVGKNAVTLLSRYPIFWEKNMSKIVMNKIKSKQS